MQTELYPICFEPIAQSREWGGDLLQGYFGRPSADSGLPAEMFALVDDGDHVSRAANGALAGKTLREIVQLGKAISGHSRPIAGFPIRVKFLATGAPLALQFHPVHSTRNRIPGAHPRNKVWYVVSAQPDATVQAELMPTFTQLQLLSRLGSETLQDVLYKFESCPGDCYFLPSGRIHALSAGNLILSIEQVVGSTYNLPSPGFPELPGSEEISTPDLARDLINFKDRTMPRIRAESSPLTRNRKIPLVMNCPNFTVEEIRLANEMHDRTTGSACHILIPIDIDITVANKSEETQLPRGQACLIPAELGYYTLRPSIPGRVLRVANKI